MTAPTLRHGRCLKVLQVIGSMHIGGAENVIAHLARGLDRERFDVGVCCTRQFGVLAEELRSSGLHLSLVAPPRRNLRHFTPLFLLREIHRFGADVVHTHGTPAMLHAGPLGFARMLPRWVHTFHFGNYTADTSGDRRRERLFLRGATQLVAVSEAQRRSLVETQNVRPDDIVTVPNGVAASASPRDVASIAQARRDFGFGADDIVVGCVAVLSEQKGITYLLDAARQLLHTDRRFRFLIVGGGALERSLRERSRDLGLEPHVTFTGWRTDGPSLLPVLDIFVMSSLWEAMPMALLEAMAARRCIVVTDVGDNRNIVDDGRCAELVPPRDPLAIVEAVLRIVNDPIRANTLADNALRRFNEHFTTARMVRSYEDLYERISAPRRDRGAAVPTAVGRAAATGFE